MNIRWDAAMKEFVAEFSSDFAGDLAAVKAAGFHTDGPPEWRWFAPAPGIKALNRLRAKRPASGLTISIEALEIYKPLQEIEEKNLEVRARLADAKKAQKKEAKLKAREIPEVILPEGRWWTIGPEDLPSKPSFISSNPVVPFLGEVKLCEGCGDRLYFYDYPDICLWCSKNNILEDIF